MDDRICSCGRIMGAMLECQICGKECCIICVAEGDEELCTDCNAIKLQSEEDQHLIVMKSNLAMQCMLCTEPWVVSDRCADCKDPIQYCETHREEYRCTYQDFDMNEGMTCKRELCQDHSVSRRCSRHCVSCQHCGKTIPKDTAHYCRLYECKAACCDNCFKYTFPNRETVGQVCQKHVAYCTRNTNVVKNHYSVTLECSYPKCHTKGCHKCHGIKNDETGLIEVYCIRHNMRCKQCEKKYPYDLNSYLVAFHRGNKYESWLCPSCCKQNLDGFRAMMMSVNREGIILPRDVRIMIWNKVLN